jgi:hypothetical protein
MTQNEAVVAYFKIIFLNTRNEKCEKSKKD